MLKYDAWVGSHSEGDENADALFKRIISSFENLKAKHKSGALGYLNLPEQSLGPFFAFEKTLSTSIEKVLVIGIGGSSLGPRAVYRSWAEEGKRELLFSENIDPASFVRLVSSLDPIKTMVCVITKSGSTLETMSKFWNLYHRFEAELGERGKDHFVAITDPHKGPLRELVDKLGITSFPVPPEIGGRFSVMCAVGMLPLVLCGYPVERFLSGARDVVVSLNCCDVGRPNAIMRAVFDHYMAYQKGYENTVMMPYIDAFEDFSEWFCQLWGESLAKDLTVDGEKSNVSFTPLRALGTVDQHSQLQLYTSGRRTKHIVFIETEARLKDKVPLGLPDQLSHLEGKSFSEILFAETRGTQAALNAAGVPTSRWVMDKQGPEEIAKLMMIYMIITSTLGDLYRINPYDQPGVEFGKRVAHGYLGKKGCEEEKEIVNNLLPKYYKL